MWISWGSTRRWHEITDANFSVLERIAHWQAGLAMFGDHPWLGVGIGNYAAAYAQYAPPHWYEPLGHAHNIAIHLLAETGILGGLAFLAFWLALAGAAIRAMPGSDPARRAFALGILGTWVYVSIHGVFDNLFVQHMQLNLALLWAGLIALGVAGQTRRRPLVPRSTTRDGMIAVAP
jgi:O-antigen ligase